MSLYLCLIICLSLIHHCKSVEVTSIAAIGERVGKCILTPEAEKGEIFVTIAREHDAGPQPAARIALNYGEKISYTNSGHSGAARTGPHPVTLTCRNGPWEEQQGTATPMARSNAGVEGLLEAKLTQIRNRHIYLMTHPHVLGVEYEWPEIKRDDELAILTRDAETEARTAASTASTASTASLTSSRSSLSGLPAEEAPVSLGGSTSSLSSSSLSSSLSSSSHHFRPMEALRSMSSILSSGGTSNGGISVAHENYYDLMDDYYYDLEVEAARQKRAMSRLQRQRKRARKIGGKSRRFRYI